MRASTTLPILLLAFCVGHSTEARGESFNLLPDGSLVVNAAYTTHGVFTCQPGVPCTGSGTASVTLGSMTITFSSTDTVVAIGNIATRVPLGEFTVGGGSGFPALPNPNTPILGFSLSLTQSSPAPGAGNLVWFFGPGGGSALPLLMGNSWIQTPVGPLPAGFNYPSLVYTVSPFPVVIAGNGVTPVTADAGLVPEPATLIITVTGLLGAAQVRRRQRRD